MDEKRKRTPWPRGLVLAGVLVVLLSSGGMIALVDHSDPEWPHTITIHQRIY